MTNEVSPNVITSGFCKMPRLMFITINPNKGLDFNLRVNKIGKWSDYLRKISDDFIIVRELTGGIHFHGLFSLKKDKTIKYIKNIHFNVQSVSGPPIIPDMEFIYMNLCETAPSAEHLIKHKEVKQTIDREYAKDAHERSMTRKEKNVSNIVRYILKDKPSNILEDYIYLKETKLQKLIDQAVPPTEGERLLKE